MRHIWSVVLATILLLGLSLQGLAAQGELAILYGSSDGRSMLDLQAQLMGFGVTWHAGSWTEPEVRGPSFVDKASVSQSMIQASYFPFRGETWGIGVTTRHYSDIRSARERRPDPGNPGEFRLVPVTVVNEKWTEPGLVTYVSMTSGHLSSTLQAAVTKSGASFDVGLGWRIDKNLGFRAGWRHEPLDDWYTGPYVALHGSF